MYELIHADRGNIAVARACRVLQVARSGYCQWLHAETRERSIDDAVLAAEIKEVFHEHKGRYGAPRIRRALRPRGARPSKKRVARLMRAHGLAAIHHVAFERRRTRGTRSASPRICSSVTSMRQRPTRCSQATSRIFRRATDGCTWQSFSTCTRGVSWVGRCRTASTLSWPSLRCTWRPRRDPLRRAGSITPTETLSARCAVVVSTTLEAHFAFVHVARDAIPVVLEFVQPLGAGWRSVHERRELCSVLLNPADRAK
jgi:hypothetical protein